MIFNQAISEFTEYHMTRVKPMRLCI